MGCFGNFNMRIPGSLWSKCTLAALLMVNPLFGATLDYAPAPADNPLRGLVPYVDASAKDRFPHSMEFRYFALKDIMKGPESLDWSPLEEALAEVGQRGNQLIFRIYCEYPGKESAIPPFLIQNGLRMTEWTNPADGVVSHTPDYENPQFREALRKLIIALGDKYDGDPRVAFVTAGLLGSWGEWHTYPRDDLWASKEVQREVMDAYAKAFTQTKILLRYPAGADTYGYAENHNRPLGYHDDSFGWATLDTGKEGDAWFFEPSLKTAGAADKWKRFPIGGEIRPELWRQSFTARRHPKDQDFVTCVERLHVSWLMDSGLFDTRFPMDEERRKTALRETARMGYELHISQAVWKDGVLELTVENRGVAPFYSDWPVELVAEGESRETGWKLTEVLPGQPTTWSIKLPTKSEVAIRIPNPLKGGKALRFANREQGEEWLVITP